MNSNGTEEKGLLRSNNIILDVREAVIAKKAKNEPVKLSAYYQLVGNDRAIERIQDAIRQLVEARKNSKASGQIANRRDSLSHAFGDSMSSLTDNNVVIDPDEAAKSVDNAILTSIAKRSIQHMAYGNL